MLEIQGDLRPRDLARWQIQLLVDKQLDLPTCATCAQADSDIRLYLTAHAPPRLLARRCARRRPFSQSSSQACQAVGRDGKRNGQGSLRHAVPQPNRLCARSGTASLRYLLAVPVRLRYLLAMPDRAVLYRQVGVALLAIGLSIDEHCATLSAVKGLICVFDGVCPSSTEAPRARAYSLMACGRSVCRSPRNAAAGRAAISGQERGAFLASRFSVF